MYNLTAAFQQLRKVAVQALGGAPPLVSGVVAG